MFNSGHGRNTAGKRGPFIPPSVREYEFNIAVVKKAISIATSMGITTIHLDPELDQVRLYEIVRRANAYYETNRNSMLISVHANAVGNGKSWNLKASGSTTMVAPNASMRSKKFAAIISPKVADAAYFRHRGVKTRGFYVLKKTAGPAVMTENGFMTHPDDATKLSNDYWRTEIAKAHVDAMAEWIGEKIQA
jgi:N-acetylmuramoyl-L-alanine amidase